MHISSAGKIVMMIMIMMMNVKEKKNLKISCRYLIEGTGPLMGRVA